MGHAIPKIHYKVFSTTGDTTSGNPTITNILDTTNIEVGMLATGAGVPAGVTVLSKTSSTVVLSANASATASGVSLEFYFKIEFSYPPIETAAEKYLPQERRSTSLSGLTQVSLDHTEGVRELNFAFLTAALFTEVENFYLNSARYGDSFRYFEDKTLSPYTTYELKNLDWLPQKSPAGNATYKYAVPLVFRRVV